MSRICSLVQCVVLLKLISAPILKVDLLEIIANGKNSGVEFKRDDVRPEQLAKKLETYFIILIEKQILAQQGLYPYFATS